MTAVVDQLPLFTDTERRAWEVPEEILPSEWAERYRILGDDSSEPGPFRNERTPYAVEIMDTFADPGVELVAVMAAAQMAKTESALNVLGWWIDTNPGPTMWVHPDEKSTKEFFDERVGAMLGATPAVGRHLTTRAYDVKRVQVRFDAMRLYGAWAGSPMALASRAIERVIFDEVDKYPLWSGREADPISLGTVRTRTFPLTRKIGVFSTPTTKQGPIYRTWAACGVQLTYHVPCPECGAYQLIAFNRIRYEKRVGETRFAAADRLEDEGGAWYECRSCDAHVPELAKREMVAKGVWIDARTQSVGADGQVQGPRSRSRRVGFHLPGTICPWLSWSELLADFLRAQGDPEKMMNFRNSQLGEIFEEKDTAPTPELYRRKLLEPPRARTIPPWAVRVVATADTQDDCFWFVIRAWGWGRRSQLVHHGRAVKTPNESDVEQLYRICLESTYEIAGTNGHVMSPELLLVDSGGHRTEEIYRFAKGDPERVIPIRGHGGARRAKTPILFGRHRYEPKSGADPFETKIWTVDTQLYKNRLMADITARDEKGDLWLLNDGVGPTYLTQMASEHRVVERRRSGVDLVWKPVSAGVANHLWDCEVYQEVAADVLQLDVPVGVDPNPNPEPEREDDDVESRGGWLDGVSGNWRLT